MRVRTAPRSSSAAKVGPVSVISSSPSAPCTTSARSLPERREHARDRLDQRARVHADELALRADGVQQRTEAVHHGADRKLRAHRGHVAHGRVRPAREEGPDADLAQHPGRVGHRQVGVHAERLEHVEGAGPARGGAVAVLRDGHAGAGHHEGGGGRDVEGAAAVAAGAAGVDRARVGQRRRLGVPRAARAPPQRSRPRSRPWCGAPRAAPRCAPGSPRRARSPRTPPRASPRGTSSPRAAAAIAPSRLTPPSAAARRGRGSSRAGACPRA